MLFMLLREDSYDLRLQYIHFNDDTSTLLYVQFKAIFSSLISSQPSILSDGISDGNSISTTNTTNLFLPRGSLKWARRLIID